MRKPSRPPHLSAISTSPEITALQSNKGLTSNKYFSCQTQCIVYAHRLEQTMNITIVFNLFRHFVVPALSSGLKQNLEIMGRSSDLSHAPGTFPTPNGQWRLLQPWERPLILKRYLRNTAAGLSGNLTRVPY